MTTACTATRHGGTRSAYVGGCRCPNARAANTTYQRSRERRAAHVATGAIPAPTVTTGEARAVVEQLLGLGWTRRRICAVTGINRSNLSRLQGGTRYPVKYVYRDTYDRLHALLDQDPVHAGGHLVDAYPTWQRIRGLIALGYTKKWIASQLGQTGHGLQINPYRITAHHAELVRDLADTYGATAGPSLRARNYAAARSWTPDLIWQAADNDDDPEDVLLENDADPVVIERLINGVSVPGATRDEQYTAYRTLRDRGLTATPAAEQVGASSALRTVFATTYDMTPMEATG